jgi:hypothetical protein
MTNNQTKDLFEKLIIGYWNLFDVWNLVIGDLTFCILMFEFALLYQRCFKKSTKIVNQLA